MIDCIQMSIRENIRIFHPIDIEQYLEILKTEYGAGKHPQQENTFLIEGLPFYAPQLAEGYTFVLGFNMMPLSHLIIQALVDRQELIPQYTKVRWMQEQDLIFDGQLGDFKNER